MDSVIYIFYTTSGNLYLPCKHIQLYLSSEYINYMYTYSSQSKNMSLHTMNNVLISDQILSVAHNDRLMQTRTQYLTAH